MFDMAVSPAPSDYCQYEPPTALWELVETYVPPHERQEIRKMLGESLVEQSLELHQEVNTLLEIWRDYRDETEAFLTRNRLPEPPAARERLKQEIRFFVQSIREKAKDSGRDASQLLEKHNTEIIDYALDTERASSGYESRPSTARSSRDGRETPMMRVTPTSDRVSMLSLSDEVEAINDKLTYLKFDEVVQHLRETLEEEVAQLMRDTEFLQSCLDDEADLRTNSRSGSREPTLTDLREERSKLEKDLLTDISTVPKVLRSNSTKQMPPVRPLNSSISPGAIPKIHPTPPSSIKKTSPIKASHNISIPPNKPSSASQRMKTKSHECNTDSGSSKANGDHNNNPTKSHRSYKFKMPDTSDHVTVKTKSSATSKISSLETECDRNNVPSPPRSAKATSRPGSATRFRQMVMECRDGQ